MSKKENIMKEHETTEKEACTAEKIIKITREDTERRIEGFSIYQPDLEIDSGEEGCQQTTGFWFGADGGLFWIIKRSNGYDPSDRTDLGRRHIEAIEKLLIRRADVKENSD